MFPLLPATLACIFLQLSPSTAFVGMPAVLPPGKTSLQMRGESQQVRQNAQHNSDRHLLSYQHHYSHRLSTRLCVGAADNEIDHIEQERSSDWPPHLNGNTPMKTPVPPVVGDIRRATVDTLRVRPLSRIEDVDLGIEQEESRAGTFVDLFRGCAPYIRTHQGSVMVVHMGGEVLDDTSFSSLMDDMGLLSLLGVRAL